MFALKAAQKVTGELPAIVSRQAGEAEVCILSCIALPEAHPTPLASQPFRAQGCTDHQHTGLHLESSCSFTIGNTHVSSPGQKCNSGPTFRYRAALELRGRNDEAVDPVLPDFDPDFVLSAAGRVRGSRVARRVRGVRVQPRANCARVRRAARYTFLDPLWPTTRV